MHTCCVTAEAERKSRRLVRRAASAGRRVVVAGCAAALHPEQFDGEGVTVAARPDWAELAGQLATGGARRARRPGDSGTRPRVGSPRTARTPPAPRATPGARTRLVLKVQDGCAGACTYCVVRLVRGEPRSVPLAQALAAAREGLAQGCGEVVLSGIDLGAWRDGDARLPELVAAVAELDGLRRVRLSSVEPRHVDAALLDLLAHPRVARHLHVPLQSADDGVLRDMRRPYTFARYLRAVEGLREVPGGAMLSTDVIVGYPTEDEAAFARTLEALRERPLRARARVRVLGAAGHGGGGAAASAGRRRQGAHGARAGGRRGGRPGRAPRRARPRRRDPGRGAARRPLEGVQFGVRTVLAARSRAARRPGTRRRRRD